MIRERGLTLVELDSAASRPYEPVGIITADKPTARAFEDGIAVTSLPTAEEAYRVSVFSVDTSPLYYEDDVVEQVLERTSNQYGYDEKRGATRTPMIDPEYTDGLYFSARTGAKNALVVSFIVAASQAPSEVTISFGHVEVLNNYSFGTFANKCRRRPNFVRYAKAATFLQHYLENGRRDCNTIFDSLTRNDGTDGNERGLNITRAFNTGAGHLVAKAMREEGRPIPYRTHFRGSPFDVSKATSLAFFSTTPSPHSQLRLDELTKVTSPARKAEDFMTLGQLHGRDIGREPSTRDKLLLQKTVDTLNIPILNRRAEMQTA